MEKGSYASTLHRNTPEFSRHELSDGGRDSEHVFFGQMNLCFKTHVGFYLLNRFKKGAASFYLLSVKGAKSSICSAHSMVDLHMYTGTTDARRHRSMLPSRNHLFLCGLLLFQPDKTSDIILHLTAEWSDQHRVPALDWLTCPYLFPIQNVSYIRKRRQTTLTFGLLNNRKFV